MRVPDYIWVLKLGNQEVFSGLAKQFPIVLESHLVELSEAV
jgi:hypothetical protein